MDSISSSTEVEALDPAYVAKTLSNPPFVTIAGVHNVRDIGSLPLSTNATMVTRPRFAYRAAEISTIQESGMEQMRALGITTVYDLRSDAELAKYNTPVPTIPAVRVLRVPVFEQKDYSPTNMARRFQMYASGRIDAFMKLYSEILEAGGSAFGTILRHVRDKPDEGFLFHCTAGKDRTGVAAALLLSIAGVDDQAIAHDYSLTRVGREPFREAILKRLEKEPIFASNNDAALNMLSSRHETMVAFMKMLHDNYGGAAGYAKQFCDLTDEDLATIRRNLIMQKTKY